MKKIIYFIVLLLIISSCNDILDLTPRDRISEESVWEDEKLTELYVTTCYHAVEHGFYAGLWGGGISGETMYIGSQNYVLQGSLTPDNVTSVDPTDSYLKIGTPPGLNYWKNAYSYIRKINVFFEQIDGAKFSDDVKNKMKGEMKFLRAFTYSNLIWRYGGVPIIDYTFELNDDYYTSFARASYDDCVTFIIKDLDDAITLLPDQQTGSNLGRASADAAKALKSRVLLYAASLLNNPSNDKTKWQKAADAAEKLLNTRYSLYSDYQYLFLPSSLSGNKEIIFARYFTQANCHYIHVWNGRNADYAAGSTNAPTQNIVDAYQMTNGELPFLDNGSINPKSGYDPQNPYVNRDPRFEATILHDGSFWRGRITDSFHGGLDSPEGSIISNSASATSYYLKKFVQSELVPAGDITKSAVNSTSPYIFFRYAEILLNYAEAKFELGDEATARQYLNMVRSRTGVEMPSVIATGQELRKKIQNERQVELAFEGHRYFDVRRWKIASDTENKNVMGMNIVKLADGTKTYTPYKILERHFYDQLYLVPIPRTEIDKSLGALNQNPGY